LLAITSVGIAASIAFAPIFTVTAGVHFKDIPMDFGDPPARYEMYYDYVSGPASAWRAGTTYYQNGGADEFHPDVSRDEEEKREELRKRLFKRAENAERGRRYREALAIWKRCVREDLDSCGCAKERVRLLSVFAPFAQLRGASRLLKQIPAEGQTHVTIPDSELDPRLRPLADYERIDDDKNSSRAGSAYLKFANDNPRSPLAESALIMAPRTLLAADAEPTAIDFTTAQIALDDLARRFPHSRFTAGALGWRGRIAYLKHNYAAALNLYRRQYAKTSLKVAIDRPLQSIIDCENHLGWKAAMVAGYLLRYGLADDITPKMAARNRARSLFGQFEAWDGKMLWSLMRSNPQVLAYYMDYRLESTSKVGDVLDLARLYGKTILESKYRARFAARVAEAAFRSVDYVTSIRYARIALNSNPADDVAGRALYLLGSIARRTGKPERAIRHFEAILTGHPKSYLCNSVRECLGLLYEGQGRMGDALDVYRKLEYEYDVDYLLDMKMSPQQMKRYLAAHPGLKRASRDTITYSIGLRYMRMHQWSQAEQAFGELSRKRRISFTRFDDSYHFDPDDQVDPMKSTRDLARLDRAVKSARGSDQKAKAMFAMASYYDKHRNLMLYNARLWQGMRADVVNNWNDKAATDADRAALDKHHWQHESLAQCLLICRKIVSDYPKSPVRFKAAYLGATAAEHLSRFNGYWRWSNDVINLDLESVHLMKVAAGSGDPSLSKKANKFAGVFTEERYRNRQELVEFKHHRAFGRWESWESY